MNVASPERVRDPGHQSPQQIVRRELLLFAFAPAYFPMAFNHVRYATLHSGKPTHEGISVSKLQVILPCHLGVISGNMCGCWHRPFRARLPVPPSHTGPHAGFSSQVHLRPSWLPLNQEAINNYGLIFFYPSLLVLQLPEWPQS